MKRCYFTVFACFFLLGSYSQNNQVIINNGNWNDAATWDLGHPPQNGEVAILPSGTTTIIDNNVTVSTNITLKIYGSLIFQVGKLRLAANSVVLLYTGGAITSQLGTPSDKIEIDGVSKYVGSDGTLSGPLMASSSSTGFDPMPIILPVKFISYAISKAKDGILIKWSTTEEINAALYIIERSADGRSWQVIGQVQASQKPAAINYYLYTDKALLTGVTYYRIKQVDSDGQFTYTSVRSIRLALPSLTINVSSFSNSIVIKFSQQLKSNVVIRLIALSGQVVAQQTYYQPAEYFIFKKGVYSGQYILTISNGEEIKITKQLFLM